ncbi:MAG: DUF4625 domain-containing protein [Rikenellaceae bacterium]
MKLKSLFAALLLSVALISCEAEGDVTKPVIDLTSPAEGEQLEADSTGMHFEVSFSDDEGLSSYKVEIHSNFDGHTHASLSRHDDEDTVDFSYNNSWVIEGSNGETLRNEDIHHHEIIIPSNATRGDYHFTIYCTDLSGNQSYVVRNVEIVDPSFD